MATTITTLAGLQAMEDDLTEDYILGNDIDASATSGWNGGLGFDPIQIFSGTFDGQKYTITDLFVNRPTEDNVGLFGYAATGSITDLKLADCDITGQNYVGGLIGVNDDFSMTQCGTTGSVSGASEVGGLAGRCDNNVLTVRCYSTADVTATGDWAGGLIARNADSSHLTNCYARGSVTSTGDWYTGGLVGGTHDSNVTTCYSTGLVTASGGLVGGLIGWLSGTSAVTNSFWDTTTSSQSSSDGGTGRTTGEMKAKLTYSSVAWDFDTIWDICTGGTTTGGHTEMSNLGRTIKLPSIPPQIDNEEIRKYLQELERAIKDFVERVYDDLHY